MKHVAMGYKVIARKFRPQNFEQVIGQKHVIQTLQNAISRNRIPHAFLFTGERGVGKTSVARILAKALNCEKGPIAIPCNTCSSCMEITAGNSMDVNEIDGASHTGIDDIRSLREHVRFLPARDKYKIYIIDEVHMLSTSAFNGLLKTLEEPPDYVIFIFATTEPQKIPDTIISRCMRFDFRRIPAKQIVSQLKQIADDEEIIVSTQGLVIIAKESDGSMRDAQTIFERAISYCEGEITDTDLRELLGYIDKKHIYQIMDAVLAENAQACMEVLNGMYQMGIDIIRFYYSFLEHLRNLTIIKTAKDSSQLIDAADEDLNKLKDHAGRISGDALQRCFRLWFSSENEIRKSGFQKTAVELCLLELINSKKAIAIDDMLSKINWLQKQLESRGSTSPALFNQIHTDKKQFHPPDKAAELQPAENKNAQEFLAFVRKKHPPTASILGQGQLSIDAENVLSIELPAGSFFIEKIKGQETTAKITEFGRLLFKKEINIKVVPVKKKETREKSDKKKEHPADNPIVQKILQTFNGRIVSSG